MAVRRLGDEVLVYVGPRFETHLLSGAGGLVVEILCSASVPCTSQKLQELLFAAEPVDVADVDGAALLAPLLTQLLGLGVLSAQPC